MVDKKIYKTDYQSDFARLMQSLEDSSANVAVSEEKTKYARIFTLRDKANLKNSRNKLWENF